MHHLCHPSSLVSFHPFLCSVVIFMRYWEDGHFGWEVAGSQGEWSVPSIRQLSPRCLLMMISLEPGLHTHKHTHKSHVASPQAACLPGCTGDSQGPWWSVSPRSLVSAWVWVCVASAECIGELKRDLPGDPCTASPLWTHSDSTNSWTCYRFSCGLITLQSHCSFIGAWQSVRHSAGIWRAADAE